MILRKLAALFWKSEHERALDCAFEEAVRELDSKTTKLADARKKLVGAGTRCRQRSTAPTERQEHHGN